MQQRWPCPHSQLRTVGDAVIQSNLNDKRLTPENCAFKALLQAHPEIQIVRQNGTRQFYNALTGAWQDDLPSADVWKDCVLGRTVWDAVECKFRRLETGQRIQRTKEESEHGRLKVEGCVL